MKKILVPGLMAGMAMLVAGMVFSQIFGWVFPSIAEEYLNTSVFRPWSDPLMQLYFAYPFVLGIVLAFAWQKIHSQISGKDNKKVQNFAIFYWILAAVPGMLITLSSFQVSLLIVLSWTISGLLQAYIGAWVISKKMA